MPSASEVPAGVGGTLNFTLCVAQNFTAASPLLHLAQSKLHYILSGLFAFGCKIHNFAV